MFRRVVRAVFNFPRLSTQRIRHCGLSDTYRTRSQPCDTAW